jgi:hypothetical protein
MFNDELLPELNRLDFAVSRWKRSLRAKVTDRLLFGAAAVTIGLYSGILPQDIGKVIAAVGGWQSASNILSDLNESMKDDLKAKEKRLLLHLEGACREVREPKEMAAHFVSFAQSPGEISGESER